MLKFSGANCKVTKYYYLNRLLDHWFFQ